MKKPRLHEIDLIKVVAMFAVFTIHYTVELQLAEVSAAVQVFPKNFLNLYLGAFGVSLFFIASGAALQYIYGEACALKQYFKKRFLAIYPMFWMAFLIAFGFSFLLNRGINETIPKWKIIYSIIGFDGCDLWFEGNFYQLGEWFLGVIICLYLIFPLLRYGLKKCQWLTIGISMLIYILCIVFFSFNDSPLPIESFALARIPEFLFGMLFIKYRDRFKTWQLVFPVIGIAIICIFPMESIHVMVRDLVVGSSSFVILAWLLKKIPFKGIVVSICNLGGKYCYAFFLVHHVIITYMAELFAGGSLSRSEVYLLYGVCLGLTAIATKLLYDLHGSVMKLFQRQKA